MKKMFVALLLAVTMILGLAGPASADVPKKDCSEAVTKVERVNAKASGTRVYAMARSKRPIKIASYATVLLGIEIFQPNKATPDPKDGKWVRYGKPDSDKSDQVALSVVEVTLLPGTQRYRAFADFGCVLYKGTPSQKSYHFSKNSPESVLMKSYAPFFGVSLDGKPITPKPGDWGTDGRYTGRPNWF